ncbi:MAG: DUF2845 domain-containing protein [Desulfobacterales bacterium]
MKLTKTYLLIILSLVFGFSGHVFAIGLRCGNRLITAGDTKAKVISQCGVPDYTEQWEEERIMRDFHHPFYYEDDYEWGREPFLVKVPVKFERWYYNFGPTQLIHYLKFRNGKLIKITTGERGY